MTRLDEYGTPELGGVTGNNGYFTLSEFTRRKRKIGLTHLPADQPTRHEAPKGHELLSG